MGITFEFWKGLVVPGHATLERNLEPEKGNRGDRTQIFFFFLNPNLDRTQMLIHHTIDFFGQLLAPLFQGPGKDLDSQSKFNCRIHFREELSERNPLVLSPPKPHKDSVKDPTFTVSFQITRIRNPPMHSHH